MVAVMAMAINPVGMAVSCTLTLGSYRTEEDRAICDNRYTWVLPRTPDEKITWLRHA